MRLGVLIAEVNLKYVWEVVSRIKVGQAGYIYVVSADGDLIAHPDISLVLQKRRVKDLPQVQAALAGGSGLSMAQPNLSGQKVFAASAPIPDLGWAVLVERPAAEAYAPLYASILRTSILLLLGLGMAVAGKSPHRSTGGATGGDAAAGCGPHRRWRSRSSSGDQDGGRAAGPGRRVQPHDRPAPGIIRQSGAEGRGAHA